MGGYSEECIFEYINLNKFGCAECFRFMCEHHPLEVEHACSDDGPNPQIHRKISPTMWDKSLQTSSWSECALCGPLDRRKLPDHRTLQVRPLHRFSGVLLILQRLTPPSRKPGAIRPRAMRGGSPLQRFVKHIQRET